MRPAIHFTQPNHADYYLDPVWEQTSKKNEENICPFLDFQLPIKSQSQPPNVELKS